MLIDKFKKTVKSYNLISPKDKIVVGVSAGPDSVALFYLLQALKKETGISLHIAHLDHMLRKDSSYDAVFVRHLAERMCVEATIGSCNVRALCKKGSIEEAARNARFDFLFRVAKQTGANKIALGHNLDDQAETVIMRILRGSGLSGLSAILPKRKMAGYEVIRPLIGIKRKEIEVFLKRKKIKTRLDRSNTRDIYLRNRIRNKLLPLLEKEYNSNIKEVLANMAENVAYDYDYLNGISSRIVARQGKGRIKLEDLIGLHPAIQRLIFRTIISRVKGNTRRINFSHIREVEDLVLNRPTSSIVDLPNSLSVIKRPKTLLFYLR
ncbi:MAG: tRNA lysidine(34) synthetase TilS [Candidatus Omnitrophota bacterium]